MSPSPTSHAWEIFNMPKTKDTGGDSPGNGKAGREFSRHGIFLNEGPPTAIHCLRSIAARAGCYATVLTLLIAALAVVAACSSSSGDQAVSSAPVPRTGQEVFASTCALCHGASGQGQHNWHIANDDGTLPPPPLNGDGHTWHHADGYLYRVVSQGGKINEDPLLPSFKSAMPAFGDQFSHEEIISVIEYVKSLWGDKTGLGWSIRESQAIVSERDPFPPAGE
jgi:mono/diheme cytochrome c family protein